MTIVPRVLVIIDSSGSMGERDLGIALGFIGKVLGGFRLWDGVRVLVGDYGVQAVEKVFDPKKLQLTAGGGTNMDLLIVEGAKLNPKPQLIVVATDGITPWPLEHVGIPVVACLTRESSRDSVPSWIKTIVLA